MGRAIELMRDAFTAISERTVDVPVRTSLSNAAGTMLYKPVLLSSAGLFGMKAAGVFPGNADRHQPVTTGVMLVNDAETGLPLALMDAQYLTALRTGAATGLATRLLANPETTIAALIGTGGQAACQLEAMLEVLPLQTVYVFSRARANAESFCRVQAGSAGECQLVPATSREVLRECGVITTATCSRSPVIADQEVGSGVHVNGIGSFRPDMAEVPAEVVCRSSVFVDQREAALQEAGDLLQPIQSGKLPANFSPAELGEVLLGHRPGRSTADEVTFFKSVGNAAQDIVCAAEIVATAKRDGIGRTVSV